MRRNAFVYVRCALCFLHLPSANFQYICALLFGTITVLLTNCLLKLFAERRSNKNIIM